MAAEAPLIELRGLAVRFPAAAGTVTAVAGVDLELAPGASLGIVGESGSGKTQLALAMAGLTAPGALLGGSVRYRGEELVGAAPRRLRQLRGARIGFVFQDPQAALAPHLTVGTQLTEALRAHERLPRAVARARSLEMLARVQVPDPAMRLAQYPHQLSGGLRQRVLIAIALMAGPELVIADEPTTALDVTVEAGILALFASLRETLGMALVLISHDLAVVGGLCESIAVMYAGRVVESGATRAVLTAPRHPYTHALAAAVPRLEAPPAARLVTIPGAPPEPGSRAPGCAFAPRCPRAVARCTAERPELVPLATGAVACHLPLGTGGG